MRILVVSTLYPPVAFGGYEVECAGVVDAAAAQPRRARAHDPRSGEHGAGARARRAARAARCSAPTSAVRCARRSPRCARSARRARALAWGPELIYAWNGSSIPQAALRVLADSGVPLAFRVCEHWFGGLFTGDQFLRELIPARRAPARAAWAAGCRALNALPALRLRPTAPLRAAISWNSDAHQGAWCDAAVHRRRCSSGSGTRCLATATSTPPSCASRRPDAEIVFLGRVTPYKGLDVAIEALALLRAPPASRRRRLIVVGPEDAAHGAEMRALAERLGVAGAVALARPAAARAGGRCARSGAHALIVPSTLGRAVPARHDRGRARARAARGRRRRRDRRGDARRGARAAVRARRRGGRGCGARAHAAASRRPRRRAWRAPSSGRRSSGSGPICSSRNASWRDALGALRA